MATKKVLTDDELILDLLTKINSVFKSCTILITGQVRGDHDEFKEDGAKETLLGKALCTIKEPFLTPIQNFLKANKAVGVKYEKLKDSKGDYKNSGTFFDRESIIYKNFLEYVQFVNDASDKVIKWNPFITEEKQIEDLYDNAFALEYPIKSEELGIDTIVIISKSTLPILTKKRISEVEFGLSTKKDGTLFMFVLRYQFTHFDMSTVFRFIDI